MIGSKVTAVFFVEQKGYFTSQIFLPFVDVLTQKPRTKGFLREKYEI